MGEKRDNGIKVCIVVVWFGPLPETTEIWLKSIPYNRTIDFLLITDQQLAVSFTNLKVVKSTLDEFRRLASEKLGLEVALTRPYMPSDFL